MIETSLGGRRWVGPVAWSTLGLTVALMDAAEHLENVTGLGLRESPLEDLPTTAPL